MHYITPSCQLHSPRPDAHEPSNHTTHHTPHRPAAAPQPVPLPPPPSDPWPQQGLKQEEIAELQSFFNFVVGKGQTEMTEDHLKSIARQLDMTLKANEVADMIKEGDRTGNGKISFNEFATMMGRKMGEMDSEKTVREALERFDTTGTGKLDHAQLVNILVKIGSGSTFSEREVRELEKEVGTDDDGRVERSALLNAMFASKMQ